MGTWTDAQIEAWQEAAGIKPATGRRAQLLHEISEAAFNLIKVVELERSGIREGSGCWYGSSAWSGATEDLVRLDRGGETARR